MKWLLVLVLYNGNDGGHVTTEKIKFASKELCEKASIEIVTPLYIKGETKWYREARGTCIKIK